jgi:hypothetical protein
LLRAKNCSIIAGMDWQEEVSQMHQLGLEARAKLPYENAGIPFRLRPYKLPGEHAADFILENGIGDEERAALQAYILPTFRKYKVPAVLIQSDARQVQMMEFFQHFGLPDDMGYEEAQNEYTRILEEQFDGTMENLPRHLWKDTIFTSLKGPKVLPITLSTAYSAGEDGSILFEDTITMYSGEWGLLPDWWEQTVN